MRGCFYILFGVTSIFGEVCISYLSLNEAEEIAKSYNKELLIAKEGTTQAIERTQQAISRWLPSLNYLGQFQGSEKKELFFNVFSPQNPFTASHSAYLSVFQVDQPIFSTDLIFALKASQLTAEATKFEQASTLNDLLFAVR